MYEVNVRFFDDVGVTASIGLKFDTEEEMNQFFDQLNKASLRRFEYEYQKK